MPLGDYRIFDMKYGGMPDSFVTTLEYADIIHITAASPRAAYSFRGNSCYDPDYTGTGHQPLYFDQNMTVYSKYKVTGAVFSMTLLGQASYVYVVPLTAPMAASADSPHFLELPRSKLVTCGNAYVEPSKRLTVTYTTQAILGVSDAQIAGEDYSGTDSTDPNVLWFINIMVNHADLSSNADVYAQINISYTTLFYDRRFVNPS
jgi:hypothetical protein